MTASTCQSTGGIPLPTLSWPPFQQPAGGAALSRPEAGHSVGPCEGGDVDDRLLLPGVVQLQHLLPARSWPANSWRWTRGLRRTASPSPERVSPSTAPGPSSLLTFTRRKISSGMAVGAIMACSVTARWSELLMYWWPDNGARLHCAEQSQQDSRPSEHHWNVVIVLLWYIIYIIYIIHYNI